MADIFRGELKVTTLYLQDPNAWWRSWVWNATIRFPPPPLPAGEQVYALPPQPEDPFPRQLRSWTWQYKLNLIGRDRMVTGEQIWALPPQEFREVRTWIWNLTARIPVPLPVGEQVWDLAPRDIREYRSWTWQYNLNLIGRDAMVAGEQVVALPPAEGREFRTWTWQLNSNLAAVQTPLFSAMVYDLVPREGREARTWFWQEILYFPQIPPPGEQRYDLSVSDGRQIRSWNWSYNLNLIGQDALPVGEQRWDLTVPDVRQERDWAWSYNLNLIGKDRLPTGQQVYETPREFRERRGWEWKYNLNLIGQDFFPAGKISNLSPTGVTWSQTWVLNLLESTLTVVSAPSGEQVYDRPQLPPQPPTPSWTWQYNLNLIGQDKLPVGEASTALTPIGAPRPDETWTWAYNLNLIGKDALPIGERSLDLTPRDIREFRGWAWQYILELIGQDVVPGKRATDLPAQISWLLGWTSNLLESTLAQQQLPAGQRSWELPPRDPREARSYALNLVLTSLLGQDRLTVGARVWDLAPIGPPPLVPSWTWNYNLNLIGKDALPVGEVSTALPRGPEWLLGWTQNLLQTTLAPTFAKPFNQYDWPVPRAPQQPALGWTWQYNPNLIGQDAMLVGDQRYDLWTPEPQRPAQLSTWIWQYNLNLVGKDALPVGARNYDQPPLRVFWQRSWELNLVLSTLRGQDQLPIGEALWALPPQPAQPQAFVWTWQYNPNLIGQDQLPVGDQRAELAAGPDWRIGWTQNLVAALTASQAQPFFPNAWALPDQGFFQTDLRTWISQTKLLLAVPFAQLDWPVPKAPQQPASGWTWSYNLNLIGQDQLPKGEQVFDLVPRAPAPIDQTFTSAGLSLLSAPIVYTVGKQVYDLWLKGPEYPVDLRNGPFGVNPNLYPPPPPPVVIITAIVGDPYDRRRRYRFSQPFAPMDREQYEEMLEYLARSKMNASERAAWQRHHEILLRLTEERDIEFMMLQGDVL